jgi:hypothetical protein
MRNLGNAIKQWIREYGKEKTMERVKEGLTTGTIKSREIRLGGLADGLLGETWATKLSRPLRALEAVEAVDASAFQDITGQLLVTEVQQAYNSPEFIGDKLMRVIDESAPFNLGEQVVPKISNVLDGPSRLQPGQPYPSTQMVEDWVSYPAIGKFGEVLRIFLETVLTDRTGQIQESAAKLGRRARLDREERQLSVILGLTNNFKWKGTSYNTYQPTTPWINVKSGQTVAGASHSIINEVEQLAAQMVDPYSNKPIEINPTGLLCMPESKYDFKNILRATSVTVGPYATSGDNRINNAPNPLDVEYPLYSSKIARALVIASGVSAANAKNWWFLADFQKAFIYRQVLPFETIEAPPTNPDDFNQDVVMSVKVREMGAAGTHDPRYAFKSYGA